MGVGVVGSSLGCGVPPCQALQKTTIQLQLLRGLHMPLCVSGLFGVDVVLHTGADAMLCKSTLSNHLTNR